MKIEKKVAGLLIDKKKKVEGLMTEFDKAIGENFIDVTYLF